MIVKEIVSENICNVLLVSGARSARELLCYLYVCMGNVYVCLSVCMYVCLYVIYVFTYAGHWE